MNCRRLVWSPNPAPKGERLQGASGETDHHTEGRSFVFTALHSPPIRPLNLDRPKKSLTAGCRPGEGEHRDTGQRPLCNLIIAHWWEKDATRQRQQLAGCCLGCPPTAISRKRVRRPPVTNLKGGDSPLRRTRIFVCIGGLPAAPFVHTFKTQFSKPLSRKEKVR